MAENKQQAARELMWRGLGIETANSPKEAFASQTHLLLQEAFGDAQLTIRPERFSDFLERRGVDLNDPEDPVFQRLVAFNESALGNGRGSPQFQALGRQIAEDLAIVQEGHNLKPSYPKPPPPPGK